jgi:hypothetical protein
MLTLKTEKMCNLVRDRCTAPDLQPLVALYGPAVIVDGLRWGN